MKHIMIPVIVTAMALSPLVAFAGTETYPPVVQNVVKFDTDATFYFNFDGDLILEGSKQTAIDKAKELAQYLIANPNRVIRVEGFTDEIGTKLYNYDLSARRIDALLPAGGAFRA